VISQMENEEEEEELEGKEMSFWEHLTELAIRLRRIIIVTLTLIGIYLIVPASIPNLKDLYKLFTSGSYDYTPISAYVLERIKMDMLGNSTKVALISGTFAAPVVVWVEAAAVLAIATASPYIAYELYMFIAPGLYSHEKKFLKRFLFSFSILFIAGILYGYYLIMPITFRVLIYFTQMVGASKLFTIDDFFQLVFLGLIANGLFFTMPVFLVLAIKFNIIQVDVLQKNKRYIYVIVMIITAILTPDPTPVSMLLLSIPFIFLYELSIFFGKRVKPM